MNLSDYVKLVFRAIRQTWSLLGIELRLRYSIRRSIHLRWITRQGEIYPNQLHCIRQRFFLFAGVAGLLGLGCHKLSFPSQTATTYNKTFSYCLPSSATDTGHLTFGSAGISSSVKFTPTSTIRAGASFYGLDIVGISVGGEKLEISPTVFSAPGAIIDSGTVVSRLPPKAYAALRAAFKEKMSQYPNTSAVSIFDTCFNLSGVKTVTVPTVVFAFRGGAVVELGWKGTLYAFNTSQVCLAFAGNKDDNDIAIFGNIQQQTLEVVYDGAGGRVGFAPDGCK
ncbi:hypothetical protein F2Q69_00028123 [Brassica cretica]|uniref:Peptidase A1 domain-containing protein n=1 Tax=Brassica cretica TaxID=69181 RepID=A0A8S9S332_BRACR|nr:hypothetical protein F2Q69_00028123 [Brassica cretica]